MVRCYLETYFRGLVRVFRGWGICYKEFDILSLISGIVIKGRRGKLIV